MGFGKEERERQREREGGGVLLKSTYLDLCCFMCYVSHLCVGVYLKFFSQ